MPTKPREVIAWLNDNETKDRKNARVITKVVLALPHELALPQQISLVAEFAEAAAVRRASWLAAIHAPDKKSDARNIHAHLVIRDRDPETGKTVAGLSDKGSVDRLRALWEHLANEALNDAGLDARIDRRSLEAQGVGDRLPQIHVGVAGTAMERAERKSDRAAINRAILAANAASRKLAAEKRAAEDKIARIENALSLAAARRETLLEKQRRERQAARTECDARQRQAEETVREIATRPADARREDVGHPKAEPEPLSPEARRLRLVELFPIQDEWETRLTLFASDAHALGTYPSVATARADARRRQQAFNRKLVDYQAIKSRLLAASATTEETLRAVPELGAVCPELSDPPRALAIRFTHPGGRVLDLAGLLKIVGEAFKRAVDATKAAIDWSVASVARAITGSVAGWAERRDLAARHEEVRNRLTEINEGLPSLHETFLAAEQAWSEAKDALLEAQAQERAATKKVIDRWRNENCPKELKPFADAAPDEWARARRERSEQAVRNKADARKELDAAKKAADAIRRPPTPTFDPQTPAADDHLGPDLKPVAPEDELDVSPTEPKPWDDGGFSGPGF